MTTGSGFLAALEYLGWANKILGVTIGFVVGGLVTGLVVRLIVFATTTRKMPNGILYFFRLLGGVATGLIVYWVMSSGSGPGSGGWGFGPGTGTGPGDDESPTASRREKAPPQDKNVRNEKSKGTQPLEIAVLANIPIEKIGGKKALDAQRYYRVLDDPERGRLLSLDEVKKLISPEGEPNWRYVLLVLYLEDGPNADAYRVRALKTWAESLRLKNPPGNVKVDVIPRPGNTPLN